MRTLPPVESAYRDGVTLLRAYQSSLPESRTPLLRKVAGVLVTVRPLFLRADGTPDWSGRTHAYRRFVAEMYGEAGLTQGERASVQAAVRYHVASVLRERLDMDTLEEYGLQARSQREAARDRRAWQSTTLAAVAGRKRGGAPLAISTAATLLHGLVEDDLRDLDAEERHAVDEALHAVERRVRALRRLIGDEKGDEVTK